MPGETPLDPHGFLDCVNACIALLRSLEADHPHNPDGSLKRHPINDAAWNAFDRVKRELEAARDHTAEAGRALADKVRAAGSDQMPVLRLVQRVEEVADGLKGQALLSRHDFRNDLDSLVAALRAEKPLIEDACAAVRENRVVNSPKAATAAGDEELGAAVPLSDGDRIQYQREREELRCTAGRNVPPIIGESDAILRVWHELKVAANSLLPVMILGRSGTGKELAAMMLHYASRRKDKKFVPINSANLGSGDAQISELFGHKAGAFTGATKDRPGAFLAADGGTLFLDEVADLSAEAQGRLLRAVEYKRIKPLGADEEEAADVRVLVATNAQVEDVLRAGTFREDLYHRLNGLTIVLPSLRERIEDIPLLVAHFAPGYVPKKDWIKKLISQGLPGEVRGLKGTVGRAVAQRDTTAFEDFPRAEAGGGSSPKKRRRGRQKIDLSREDIMAALDRAGGNVNKACAYLGKAGIDDETLRDRMKELGISPPT
jgi:transcriptional regulator with PAS, ATPase and Fis domain